jgi:hypothetical protein
MEIEDVAKITSALPGVRRGERGGLAEWRYHGRLVVRQIDDTRVVIRTEFTYRDVLLRDFPETFTVPRQYVKHMMIVADLAHGATEGIEDAIEAAWVLQQSLE